MDTCLTGEEIEAFVANALPADQRIRVESHMARCDRCRQAVEKRRADTRLAGDIRQAYGTATEAAPTRLALHAQSDVPVSPDIAEGYEVLHEIHRGGQGVVYKAIQKATKRTVALKVLLEGPYASARQRHRFEREIDLIASLQHPNIVTVYDSGVSQGRHYFAMEYVHGQSLDTYLSSTNLSIDQTLRLFGKICAAVNYAHQRGVIHRDLKPGNIRIDSNGEPHVLDFGLAKTAGQELTGSSPVTVTGEFMGTLAYASPEQTKGDPNLIDIRTDVYSLGVILYEMLTGKYPYVVVGQMADVLKNIVEAEPKKPSTIRRQVDDEVETIVLKALAKERERRYQSAENLARDIEHYLNGEPIDAKRDSGFYLLKKMLVRYRFQTATAIGALMLAIGSGTATWRFYQSQVSAQKEAAASTARDSVRNLLVWLASGHKEIRDSSSHREILASVCDRLRSGGDVALDYEAFAKSFVYARFSGSELIVVNDSDAMELTIGFPCRWLAEAQGLGMLLQPNVMIDGEPVPLKQVSVWGNYWAQGCLTRLPPFSDRDMKVGDRIPLELSLQPGHHQLHGYVRVQVVETWQEDDREGCVGFHFEEDARSPEDFHLLPGPSVDVPIPPTRFIAVASHPEHYPIRISDAAAAKGFDDAFVVEAVALTLGGAHGPQLRICASFPLRFSVACEVVVSVRGTAWRESCELVLTDQPEGYDADSCEEGRLDIKAIPVGSGGHKCLMTATFPVEEEWRQTIVAGTMIEFQMVGSEAVARKHCSRLLAYLDFHIERSLPVIIETLASRSDGVLGR